MKRRRLVATAAAVVLAAGTAGFWTLSRRDSAADLPVSASLRLRVDISERRLYATVDGETRSYPVGVGTAKHPTPRGHFAIRRVIWNPRWIPPGSEWARNRKPAAPGDPSNPMGRVKMFFREPTYYLHGTNDEESVGDAVSHGCVRMRNADIIELAALVMEYGGKPPEPGWIRRILDRMRTSHEVRLTNGVPMEITA